MDTLKILRAELRSCKDYMKIFLSSRKKSRGEFSDIIKLSKFVKTKTKMNFVLVIWISINPRKFHIKSKAMNSKPIK